MLKKIFRKQKPSDITLVVTFTLASYAARNANMFAKLGFQKYCNYDKKFEGVP